MSGTSDFFDMLGVKASIDIKTYEKDIKAKDKEIERLNNKVEELDTKWINSLQQEEEYEEGWRELKKIIDEAREYIEERYNGEVLTHTFDKDNVGELLNILKGVDKE